jgi:hypothetical protein
MKMEVQLITPEIAAEWLRYNPSNRPLRRWWVKVLAARINQGEWRVTHQGIAFNADGDLCDGQHRLAAIVMAGIACYCAVFNGVDPKSFKAMDQGVKRTMADPSGLDKRIVEPCNYAARIAYGSVISFEQLETILEGEIGSLAEDLVGHCGTTKKFFTSAPIKLAAIVTAMQSRAHREYAFSTYRQLVLLDFDGMPRSAQALVRQQSAGKAHAVNTAHDALARGFDVFDPDKSGNLKVQVSDVARTNAVDRVRTAVKFGAGRSNRAATHQAAPHTPAGK